MIVYIKAFANFREILGPPPGSTDPAAPTGLAGNNTSAFVVTSGGNSAPSLFLWSTENGTVSGWNPAVDPANSVLAIDNSASEAIYKGLALAEDSSHHQFLFVTDFHNGIVEKYDAQFHFVTSFTDPSLPAGYAPFGIRNINGQLFVTFAIQDANKEDDVKGPGNGFVDVFDLNGNLIHHFASHGALNSPWALAVAPARFGKFSGALLIGNFGDGHISAFALGTGAFLGQLTDERDNVIAIDSLWELLVANGQWTAAFEPTLYFTAGIAGEDHGMFGFITPAREQRTFGPHGH